jgi:hypothetical protein
MTSKPKLHFVYNVDATPVALLLDFVHRILDPATYPCRLCDLTYGRFIKKASWSRFVAELPVDARFHLRAGFRRAFPDQALERLPAVFVERRSGETRLLISAKEVAGVRDLETLQTLVGHRVAALDRKRPPKRRSRRRDA